MKRLLIIAFCLCSLLSLATHIVGGEMIYDYLGKTASGENQYRITVKIYRDCGPGTAQLDGIETIAWLTVRKKDGALVGVYDIGSPVINRVPSTINSKCIEIPQGVCVDEGIYTYTLTLAPVTGGYYVIYQRCCRNNSILNLVNPGDQGSSYFAEIPGPEDADINSSPRFNKFPPIFLCNSLNYTFDHSATDPDGDQLVYSFSTPFQGLDGCCPLLSGGVNPTACITPPSNCPSAAPPPPYNVVNYSSPYSYTYPVASSPSFAVNSGNGKLQGQPALAGQFVVSVCVEEFRNGKLLSKHFRDFQFNIVNCAGAFSAFDPQEKCQGYNINFTNQSFGSSTYHWDFGVPGISSDTSNLVNPTYFYPDTGKYTVTLIAEPGKSCSDTTRHTILVYPPLDISFKPPPKQCFLGNAYNFSVMGTYTSSTKFSWAFSSAASPSVSTLINPPPVSFKTPGKHYVKLVANHYACIDSFIDTVRILKMPVSKIKQPGVLCAPAEVTLESETPADMPLQFQWMLGNEIVAAPSVKRSYPDAGLYNAQLVVTSYSLCGDTSRIFFTVSAKPRSEFVATPSVTSIFEPEITLRNKAGGIMKCYYLTGDGSRINTFNGSHEYREAGDYTIKQIVENSFGCTDSSTDVIRILPEHRFWIGNAFTPDANGLNDRFMPVTIGVTNYRFEIFDRWGERIFRTNDPLEGWNGTYKGKDCKQDIYVWKVYYKNIVTGEPVLRFGHVTLLRNP